MEENKRWIERYSNYHKACGQFAVLSNQYRAISSPNMFNEAALLKIFEITFELAWRTLQKYLSFVGEQDAETASDVIFSALDNGIIKDLDNWNGMIHDTNAENYIYNLDELANIADRILNNYTFALNALDEALGNKLASL